MPGAERALEPMEARARRLQQGQDFQGGLDILLCTLLVVTHGHVPALQDFLDAGANSKSAQYKRELEAVIARPLSDLNPNPNPDPNPSWMSLQGPCPISPPLCTNPAPLSG